MQPRHCCTLQMRYSRFCLRQNGRIERARRRGRPKGHCIDETGPAKRDELKNRRTYQNSSKPMVPLLSTSNNLIIIFTVWGSKFVQSPFTRAALNSFSDSCPVPFLSTALNRGNREASVALFRPGAGVGGGRESGGGRPWGTCGGPPNP
jgi:hypothetical protein